MRQTEAQIHRGMSKEQVVSILGDPSETRPFRFGNELLTTWVYRIGAKLSYIWFDEAGRVKITSLA